MELNQNIVDFLNASSASWWMWGIFSFVLGACFGSFSTACVWRVPRGISMLWPPSSCPKCKRRLTPWENIPILSWILLHGKCHGCGLPISPRYVLLELTFALLFCGSGLLCAAEGTPVSALSAWTLIFLCAASACTDCELRIIPDLFTYPVMLLGCVYAYCFPFYQFADTFCGWRDASPVMSLGLTFFMTLGTGFFGACAVYAGKLLFKRDALGWGDVKFLMAVAALTTALDALFVTAAGCILALLWCVYDYFRRGRKRFRRSFAFGPFLAFAAIGIFFSRHLLY